MWIFVRVILFGAPKPWVSVSALSGPVFCYFLIILFYLHLPYKAIFPYGVLISFNCLYCAKQSLKITLQDFFFFLTCSVHWKLPNCWLFSSCLVFEGNGKKETYFAIQQENSNALLWRGNPMSLLYFTFGFQILWASSSATLVSQNQCGLRKCGNAHTRRSPQPTEIQIWASHRVCANLGDMQCAKAGRWHS